MLGIEPELLREEHKVKKLNRFDGQEFPDPSSWTVDQVYQFIRTADGDMYANGAEAFRREVSSFFFFFFENVTQVTGTCMLMEWKCSGEQSVAFGMVAVF